MENIPKSDGTSVNTSSPDWERKGKVYLLGAGIAQTNFLTLQAQQILATAEVLVYDALVDSQVLSLVPKTCLLVDVGKRGGQPSTDQNQINQLLVSYCQEGKKVIRLKSGDPGVFGRIYPEMLALNTAECDFELIAGISSALAAPLLAGIPLTEKDISRCFAVFSAHDPESLDWSALAKIDTLVLLMAGQSLGQIIAKLCQNGRNIQDSIAIIRQAGRKEQQIWRGTLENILAQTVGVSLSPSIMVIGQVVDLAIMSSPRPLAGQTIVITRAAEQSSQFTEILQNQGAEVLEMPALEIRPPSSWQGLDDGIRQLIEFDWLILTSANAVNFFFDRLTFWGKDARALASVKIAVVGKKTGQVLQSRGLQADFIPGDFVADALVREFPDQIAGQKFLFPRVETGGREILVKELREKGGQVTEVAAYDSGCPSQMDSSVWRAFQERKVAIVTFASSKTVQNFYQLLTQETGDLSINSLLEKVCLASIGPQTSKTCQELFGRVDVEASEYTLAGLTTALIAWSQNQSIAKT
jgi:uroporphyrinogen III methyltransferase/synthase